jgi:hypothetical protein
VPTDPSLVGFPLLTQGLGLGTAPTWLTTGLAITIVEP